MDGFGSAQPPDDESKIPDTAQLPDETEPRLRDIGGSNEAYRFLSGVEGKGGINARTADGCCFPFTTLMHCLNLLISWFFAYSV